MPNLTADGRVLEEFRAAAAGALFDSPTAAAGEWSSATDALRDAGLEWEVLQVPVGPLVPTDDSEAWEFVGGQPIPGLVANVRGDTGDTLSVTSERYHPFQNDRLAAIVDDYLAVGSRLLGAGSMLGGRRVWFALSLPGDLRIAGEPVEPITLLTNGHDGGRSLTGLPIPVRWYCLNQLPGLWEVGQAQGLAFRARHTVSALEVGVEDARHSVAILAEAMALAQREGDRLAAVSLSEGQLQHVLDELWPTGPLDHDGSLTAAWEPPAPKPVTARTARSRERWHDTVVEVWRADHNANIRDTAWGGWNAIVEALDWHRRAPQDGDVFRRNLDGGTEKRRALDAVLALAG